jgi:hypothetical protein
MTKYVPVIKPIQAKKDLSLLIKGKSHILYMDFR